MKSVQPPHCEARSDEATQELHRAPLGCFVASAPRNDGVFDIAGRVQRST
jgi:hypothetical protein